MSKFIKVMGAESYNRLKVQILIHHSEKLYKAYQEAGLSDERYRWDLLLRSGMSTNVYYHNGLNDDHIDTALRNITGKRG